MKYKTLENIVQDVIYEISQVPGVAVQTYSEPILERKVQHHFDLVFNEGWWPQHYTPSLTVNYSSWTGLPTNDFESSPVIRGVEDIRWVFRPNHAKPLTRLPAHFNRNEITGTSPRFWEPYPSDTSLFRILPIPDVGQAAAEDTSTYSVIISYRSRPDDYATSATVAFDSLYLMYATVHDMLSTDADNPGDVDKYRGLADARLMQLQSALTSEIPIGHQHIGIPDEWAVR